MDVGDQVVGVGGDDGNVRIHSPEAGAFQFSQIREPNGAVLHGDGKRLLCFLPFDGLPLEETVHRHDAAALAISIPERR